MAATVAPTSLIPNVKVLDLANYKDWSVRVKTYLLAEDLWDIVQATNEPPKEEDGEADFKAWRKNDAKALYAIQSTCGDDTFCFIQNANTSKVAWDTLARESERAQASKITFFDDRSLLDAYLTPMVEGELAVEEGRVKGTRDPNFIHEILAGHEESNAELDIENIHEAFIWLIENQDGDNAMVLLDKYPNAARARFSDAFDAVVMSSKCTLQKKVQIGKRLVQLMPEGDWKVLDALYCILKIIPEADELVKCMVEKNNRILDSGNQLYWAQALKYEIKTARYLYSVTPQATLTVSGAARLICDGFKFKQFDIAWNLIQRYPNLALEGGTRTPLTELAGMCSAFLSGSGLRFWQKWIYDGINIRPPTIDGVPINIQKWDNDQSNQRHLICSVMGLFRKLVVTNLLKVKLGIFNHIYQMKVTHVRILEFLRIMCKVTKDKTYEELEEEEGLRTAMFLATERGHVEYLSHLCRANKNFLRICNEKDRSLFQFAVECRQEKAYDLIYRLAKSNQSLKDQIDLRNFLGENKNTLLHMVGCFSSLAQINHIRGAALQMQRELQWFKEVENVTGPDALDAVNEDHMTPRELFTKNHQELVKAGEKSMKETASSCTVVGALIVTMTFAASFTYPGGNDQDTGLPVFLKEKVFISFIVSDAISLFSSTTSVMIFLGILTSRYAEDDFLISLPRKMILGLLTLFLSIATMMIAFSSALYIMLDGKSSIVALVISLSFVPIASFVWMQFPFLVEIFISTYGAGVFERKVK